MLIVKPMNCGSVNTNNFSKLHNESKSKGYNINYCKVSNGEKKQSATKTTLGVLSILALGFMGWKYVIQPVAHAIKEILDIDNIKNEEKIIKSANIIKGDDRVFDGRIFNKSDAITVDYTINDD